MAEQEKNNNKTFIIIFAIIAIIYLLRTGQDKQERSPAPTSVEQARSTPEEEKVDPEQAQADRKAEYLEKLRNELDGMANFNVSTYTESKEGMLLCLTLFQAWAEQAKSGALHDLKPEEQALVDQFKKSVAAKQRQAFPILRDKYGPIARRALWEDDLEARTFGSRFTIIEFVGGLFAANRNKQAFQEGIREMLYMLRFKQSRYKWYSGASEYTYYDMETHDDNALVIWHDGARSEVVK